VGGGPVERLGGRAQRHITGLTA